MEGLSVEMLLFQDHGHGGGHQSANAFPGLDSLSYLRAADIDERCFHDLDIWNRCRMLGVRCWWILVTCNLNLRPLSRIDHDGIVMKDVFVAVPLVESCPVVAANQNRELIVGVCFLQGLQRVPGIGGLGLVEFEIAGFQVRLILEGDLHEAEAFVVIEQLLVLLEGILW